MRIGELAKSVDVNVETVRYYQRIGLVELPEKPYGGMRSYNDKDLQRLRSIRRAQQLGFSLEDIRELLELSSSDCKRFEKLATEKLNQVRARLRQLRKIESIPQRPSISAPDAKATNLVQSLKRSSQSKTSR